MRANLPDKDWFVGKSVPGRPDLVLIEFRKSGNDGHLFRAHSDAVRRDFACKVVPRSNLVGADEPSPRWRAEIEKANALRSPAVVHFVGLHEWIEPANNINCVAFVSEYVDGDNLGDFVRKSRGEITIPFIINFLETA